MSQADIQSYLGTDAQKLAQENTDAGLSTTSRLDQANRDATAAIIANLNKRGMLNSGLVGDQLGRQDLGYRQANSDAYQKFLGYLQQYQSGYLAAQNSREQALAAAYGSAADRVTQQNTGSKGITANPDHVDSAGNWVFKGTDGKFYNGDGSPYTAPASAPAPTPTPPPPTPTPITPIDYLGGGRNRMMI